MSHVRLGRTAKTARQDSAKIRIENPRDRRSDRCPYDCGHKKASSHTRALTVGNPPEEGSS